MHARVGVRVRACVRACMHACTSEHTVPATRDMSSFRRYSSKKKDRGRDVSTPRPASRTAATSPPAQNALSPAPTSTVGGDDVACRPPAMAAPARGLEHLKAAARHPLEPQSSIRSARKYRDSLLPRGRLPGAPGRSPAGPRVRTLAHREREAPRPSAHFARLVYASPRPAAAGPRVCAERGIVLYHRSRNTMPTPHDFGRV